MPYEQSVLPYIGPFIPYMSMYKDVFTDKAFTVHKPTQRWADIYVMWTLAALQRV